MSTLSNNSLSNQALVAVPVTLAAIGLIYAPARPLIGLAIIAALVMLFKPLAIAVLRTALLALTPNQSVAVAKTRKVRAASLVQAAYALNSKANQIAQTQPELAAQLRLRAAYAPAQTAAKRAAAKQGSAHTKCALNSKANQIAQTKPQLAAQLRSEAAYCLTH